MLILVCLIAFVADGQVAHANVALGGPTESHTIAEDLKLLKVHMATRTIWSDGWATHEEMATAARQAGYDAVFFADNALQFGSLNIADPGFEDVNASGMLEKWVAGTSGNFNNLAIAGPLSLPSRQLLSSSNFTERAAYYFNKPRIRSGTHSLHLSIQSNGTETGYAFVKQQLPQGYFFNQTSISYPFLFGNITFTAYVYLDSLGYAYTYSTRSISKYTGIEDNGWLFFRFNFTGPTHGPTSGRKLRLTVVYSDLPVNDYLRSIRKQLNETDSKVLYRDAPPPGQWVRVDINLSSLASTLWNQTIVDDWRLHDLEIGTRSRNGGLVAAFADDVSINVNSPVSPLEYLNEIASKLSTGDFRVYGGYALEAPLQPTLYVYGPSTFGTIRNYNLTNPEFWQTFSNEISSQGGIVVLGRSSFALRDFLAANDALGARFIDVTSSTGIVAAGTALSSGNSPAFAASTKAVSPEDYNSSSTWSVRVFAVNNTEIDIIRAISLGRAYMAVSNYTGNFAESSYGFPLGINTIYIATGDNASLRVYFTGLTPGQVRVYDGRRLVTIAAHSGNASLVENLLMREPVAHFFTALTGNGDTLAVVGNPLNFIQTSMIPGDALGIDNPDWALTMSNWNSSVTKQRLQLSVQGPAGTEAHLYLFSPQYRPDATNSSQAAHYVRIGNSDFDPRTVYDYANSTFVLSLKSDGQPIRIVFDFDISQEAIMLATLQSVGTLLALVAFPFATAFLYEAVKRLVKPKQTARTRHGRRS